MTETITLPRSVVEQALEAMEGSTDLVRDDCQHVWKALTALREALEQPPVEREPVLVVETEPDYMSRGHFYEGSRPYINPIEVLKLPIGTKLYTRPQPGQPQPRQPLTDEQIEINWQFLHDEEGNPPDRHDFARAIERAHGIGGEA